MIAFMSPRHQFLDDKIDKWTMTEKLAATRIIVQMTEQNNHIGGDFFCMQYIIHQGRESHIIEIHPTIKEHKYIIAIPHIGIVRRCIHCYGVFILENAAIEHIHFYSSLRHTWLRSSPELLWRVGQF